MTMTPSQQRAIIDKESSWIDQSFGQLDLSAFPALQPEPVEPKDSGSFAREYGDTALRRSASDLRSFLSDPDVEALERVGTETGNPAFLADVNDRRAERVVLEFKLRNPGYLPTPDNYSAMIQTLAYNSNLSAAEQAGDENDVADRLMAEGYFTVANLEAVYQALNREGLLDHAAGEPRNLSERERLRVARLAQAGRVDEAISEFLRASLDGDEPTLELLHDPRYRDLCNSAAWFVWETITEDYVPTQSREAFIRRHCGTRPITIPLLNTAWVELKKREASYARSEILGQVTRPQEPQPVTEKQIDGLTDAEVDKLYHSTLHEFARSVTRGPGMIV